jgi:CheY-like chemotaxis protein
MIMEHKKIAEIFVADETISLKTLQRALERGKKENKKVGLVLEEMGVVTGEEIADVLARQFGYQRIAAIVGHSFPREVLDLVTVETAIRYLLFPLRKEGNKLYLAIADPTETRIISNIADNLELVIIPFIATRSEILAAINKHYLGKGSVTDKRKTVLVVDDTPLVVSEIGQILDRQGYRVVTSKDGIDAFKKAISECPHVILTDKEVPGLSGYRLLDALKNLPETAAIPVILHTASLDCEEEAVSYQKGFFDFMQKPVKEVTLITRVRRAVDTHDRVLKSG